MIKSVNSPASTRRSGNGNSNGGSQSRGRAAAAAAGKCPHKSAAVAILRSSGVKVSAADDALSPPSPSPSCSSPCAPNLTLSQEFLMGENGQLQRQLAESTRRCIAKQAENDRLVHTLTMQTEMLREAVEKLEQACDLRKQMTQAHAAELVAVAAEKETLVASVFDKDNRLYLVDKEATMMRSRISSLENSEVLLKQKLQEKDDLILGLRQKCADLGQEVTRSKEHATSLDSLKSQLSESRLLIQKLTVDSQKSDSQRLYLQTTISSLREQLRLKQEAEEPLHFNIQSLKEELERLKFKDHEEKIYIQSLQDELLASERMSRATGNVDYYYNHKANRLGGDVAGNISPDIIGKVSDKSTSFEETRPYANNVGNYHHHPHTFKSSSPKKHDAPDNYHHRPQQHRHQHHQLLNDKASSSPSRAYTSSPNKSPLKKTSAVQQDNYYSSFEEDLGGFQGEDANLSSSPNSSKVVDTTAMWMEREKAYTEDVMTKFSKQISRLK